jgi:hypothetical protein
MMTTDDDTIENATLRNMLTVPVLLLLCNTALSYRLTDRGMYNVAPLT